MIDGPTPSDPNVAFEVLPREGIAPGECVEYVYASEGIEASHIKASATWNVAEAGIDCPGDSDIDVTVNDDVHLQEAIACACGDLRSYDAQVLRGPKFDALARKLTWDVYPAVVACLSKEPPDIVTIEEHLTIEGGATPIDETNSYDIGFGLWQPRIHDTSDLVPGQTYVATVEVSGPECGCPGEDLSANNRASLEFTP